MAAHPQAAANGVSRRSTLVFQLQYVMLDYTLSNLTPHLRYSQKFDLEDAQPHMIGIDAVSRSNYGGFLYEATECPFQCSAEVHLH